MISTIYFSKIMYMEKEKKGILMKMDSAGDADHDFYFVSPKECQKSNNFHYYTEHSQN